MITFEVPKDFTKEERKELADAEKYVHWIQGMMRADKLPTTSFEIKEHAS